MRAMFASTLSHEWGYIQTLYINIPFRMTPSAVWHSISWIESL